MNCPHCNIKLLPFSTGFDQRFQQYTVVYKCLTYDCRYKEYSEVTIYHDPPDQTIFTYKFYFPHNNGKHWVLTGNIRENTNTLHIIEDFFIPAKTYVAFNAYTNHSYDGYVMSRHHAPISMGILPLVDPLISIPYIYLPLNYSDTEIQKIFEKMKNLVVFT